MGEAPATSRRVRVHQDAVGQIKSLAREQLRAHGAATLSLRAIARDMGMVSSATYRYFPSREHLLTALCTDAYDSFGQALETAVAAVPRSRHLRRWWVMSHALREWALAHPAEFGLIFGAPVPGHRADLNETGPSSARFMAPPLQTYAAAVRAGAADPGRTQGLADPGVAALLQYFVERTDPPCPPQLAGLALNQLSCSLGFVALETFGAMGKLVRDPIAYYGAHVRGGMVGLGYDPQAVRRLR